LGSTEVTWKMPEPASGGPPAEALLGSRFLAISA
jgi:hypothetical protein